MDISIIGRQGQSSTADSRKEDQPTDLAALFAAAVADAARQAFAGSRAEAPAPAQRASQPQPAAPRD
ncbi:hypothetical protein, partial [Caenispirillum bisanense]|uniref:hypothetical protein n=1 Tax=Caenispirillum bisanense TaxID=414052 RepID=UPI0031D6BB92